MQPTSPARPDETTPATGPVAACSVATWGAVHGTVADLEPLRQPNAVAGKPVSATFLRHADELTVTAVAALNQTVERGELRTADFRAWGVLACLPRPGRALVGHSLSRYEAEGAWGISPHIVPHRCLHSLSGALSLALKCEGPNFGVGEPEALVPMACAWLGLGLVEGVWVVLTQAEPQPATDLSRSTPRGDTGVHAVVLALVPETVETPLRLRIRPAAEKSAGPWGVAQVEEWLAGGAGGDWVLPGGLAVERRPLRVAPTANAGRLQEVRG